MKIIWDKNKNEINLKKHNLSFQEAKQLFRTDNNFLQIFDYSHSINEDRYINIGPIFRGIIVVITTEINEEVLRIISARIATKKERLIYEKHIKGKFND
jgi:uncharacterized protein